MERFDWSRLTNLQVGRYAEYVAKMEFTLFGFDVYTSEVDDHGIDFVVRMRDNRYFDIQVKAVRLTATTTTGYIFFPKDKFPLQDNLLATVVLLRPGQEPQLYLIPATTWLQPNTLFVDHDYPDLKSKPEWGLNLSKRNLPLLATFEFNAVLERLRTTGT